MSEILTSNAQHIVAERISKWIEKGCVVQTLDLSGLGLTEFPELPSNI
jgi:hypothetical protein